jgi:hypothetical protein
MTDADGNADRAHRTRLAVLSALSEVSADLPRLVAVLADAEDDADALRRLQAAYDLTPVQAQAVLDAQLRLLTRGRRASLMHDLEVIREALAAPWDPPLDVHVTGDSPRTVTVALEDGEHLIRSTGRRDCLDRIVRLVREQVALPRLRRVMVTTSLTGGPSRILIDPVDVAEFFHDDDPHPS